MPDPESSARASLRRGLAFYTFLLVLDLLLVYYLLDAGVAGVGYLTLVVVAIVGALLGYQVVNHVRDFNAPLVETEGVVARKWSRADLIIAWHSYYLTIGRAVFKVSPQDYVMIDEQMLVKVAHFPRTLNVASVHEVRVPGREPPSSDSPPA